MREMDTSLNGYPTRKPFGKTAKELVMSLYISVADKAVTDAVTAKINNVYHSGEVNFHTFPYASLAIIPGLVEGAKGDYIFADINGEVTEFSIIKDGIVVETTSFPYGSHEISRSIAKKTSTSAEQAYSLFKAYRNGRVAPKLTLPITDTLKEIRVGWSVRVIETLKTLGQRYLLPQIFVVAGNAAIVPLFCECVREEDVSKMTKMHKPLEMAVLLPQYLDGFVEGGEGGQKDTFLCMSTLYIAKMEFSE